MRKRAVFSGNKIQCNRILLRCYGAEISASSKKFSATCCCLVTPFDVCQLYSQVCSNYCGAITISLKICLTFGQYAVHVISQKSLRKYHSLHMSRFGSAGKLYFCHYLLNTWSHGLVVFYTVTTRRTRALKALTHLRFPFSLPYGRLFISMSFVVQLW